MKQQILKTAQELFFRYGIRSVSMDDIAREHGMSKKTLYEQVDNKEDLVKEIMTNCFEEDVLVVEGFKKHAESAVEEMVLVARYIVDRMRLLSASYRYDLEKYYPLIHKEVHSQHMSYYVKKIQDNIILGKKEGLYRKNIDERIIARLFMGMTSIVSHDEFFPVHDFPLDDLVRRTFIYHMHGIISPRGRMVLSEYLGREEEEKL